MISSEEIVFCIPKISSEEFQILWSPLRRYTSCQFFLPAFVAPANSCTVLVMFQFSHAEVSALQWLMCGTPSWVSPPWCHFRVRFSFTLKIILSESETQLVLWQSCKHTQVNVADTRMWVARHRASFFMNFLSRKSNSTPSSHARRFKKQLAPFMFSKASAQYPHAAWTRIHSPTFCGIWIHWYHSSPLWCDAITVWSSCILRHRHHDICCLCCRTTYKPVQTGLRSSQLPSLVPEKFVKDFHPSQF